MPYVVGFKQGKIFLISTIKIACSKPRFIHFFVQNYSEFWLLTSEFFFDKVYASTNTMGVSAD